MLRLVPGLSEDYKDSRDPEDAVVDLAHVAGLAPGEMTVTLRQSDVDATRRTFTLYLCGESVSLTDVLPVLQSLGVAVLDEHPYELDRADGVPCWAYEFEGCVWRRGSAPTPTGTGRPDPAVRRIRGVVALARPRWTPSTP